MVTYKAILSGNFGPITVNKRLRELCEHINILYEHIGKLEGLDSPAIDGSGAEVAQVTQTTTSGAEVVTESTGNASEVVTDDDLVDDTADKVVTGGELDEDSIRQRAKALGIKSWHVKGIDKLKAEIKEAEQDEA